MRRLLWGLLAVLLLAVAALGGFLSLFGLAALATGANRGPWIFWFVALVVATLAAVGFCVCRPFQPTRT